MLQYFSVILRLKLFYFKIFKCKWIAKQHILSHKQISYMYVRENVCVKDIHIDIYTWFSISVIKKKRYVIENVCIET